MKTQGGGASAPQDKREKSETEVTPPSVNALDKTEILKTQGGAALAPQKKVNIISGTEVTPPVRHINLPHIDLKGHYQFVTFRTYDSIDNFLKRLSSENISSKIRQYKIDKYLDVSQKGCYLNNEILQFLKDFFIRKDGELYELIAFSVMPNHIHILFKQTIELAKTMQVIKGSSAFQINKLLERKGIFWEDGYYDKLIRDENHFYTTYEYIKYNAIKAELDDAEERFYGVHDEF